MKERDEDKYLQPFLLKVVPPATKILTKQYITVFIYHIAQDMKFTNVHITIKILCPCFQGYQMLFFHCFRGSVFPCRAIKMHAMAVT